jgi:hypothetical protein
MNSDALRNCLSRLLPPVDRDRIAMTGGVAIGVHLARSYGDASRGAAAEDIDFAVESVDAIRPTVTNDFLVSHFHLPQMGYPKFMVQLVDPVTRLRLDFFPGALAVLERSATVDIAGVSVRILAPEDILDHKIHLLASASAEAPVEAKHYSDAIRLGGISQRAISRMAAPHPASRAYSRDVNATCPRCEASKRPVFPLAPKQAIFDVLGYI